MNIKWLFIINIGNFGDPLIAYLCGRIWRRVGFGFWGLTLKNQLRKSPNVPAPNHIASSWRWQILGDLAGPWVWYWKPLNFGITVSSNFPLTILTYGSDFQNSFAL